MLFSELCEEALDDFKPNDLLEQIDSEGVALGYALLYVHNGNEIQNIFQVELIHAMLNVASVTGRFVEFQVVTRGEH